MKKHLLFSILGFFSTILLYSQSITINTTDADCIGNGAVSIATSGLSNPSFQLKDSDGANIGAANTSGQFSALDANNYSIEVIDENGTKIEETFTINNNYTPIPAIQITEQNICNDFSLDGELLVNVAPVTGKTYEFIVVESNDPNFDDTPYTYQPINTTWQITGYGTYQVRVKDECGEIVTEEYQVQPSLAKVESMYFNTVNNQDCADNSFEMRGIQIFGASGNVGISNYAALGGVRVEIWEKPTAGACPSTAPTGTPLFDEYINDNSGYFLEKVPSNQYVIRITTPCGETSVSCRNISNTATPSMEVKISNSGCSSNGSETLTVYGSENHFLNFPVTVTITDLMVTLWWHHLLNLYLGL